MPPNRDVMVSGPFEFEPAGSSHLIYESRTQDTRASFLLAPLRGQGSQRDRARSDRSEPGASSSSAGSRVRATGRGLEVRLARVHIPRRRSRAPRAQPSHPWHSVFAGSNRTTCTASHSRPTRRSLPSRRPPSRARRRCCAATRILSTRQPQREEAKPSTASSEILAPPRLRSHPLALIRGAPR